MNASFAQHRCGRLLVFGASSGDALAVTASTASLGVLRARNTAGEGAGGGTWTDAQRAQQRL